MKTQTSNMSRRVVICIVFVGFTLMACNCGGIAPQQANPGGVAPQQANPGGAAPQQANAGEGSQAEPKEIEVVLSMETTVISGRRVVVSGKTNLPTETYLMVEIQDAMRTRNPAQSKTQVLSDGTYKSVPLGRNEEDGEYHVSVVVPVAFTQPKSVQRLIGDKAQMLKGPLVFDSDAEALANPNFAAAIAKQPKAVQDVRNGNIVRVERKFSILGGKQAAEQSQATVKQRFETYQKMYERLVELDKRLQDARGRQLRRDFETWVKFAEEFVRDLKSVSSPLI
jgi:hypothetical protein